MIDISDIQKIHERLIQEFGGIHGIRDYGLLDSAIARPFQTFEGLDLYPSYIEKACALVESVVKNHPFIDGNKRTGYFLFRAFLLSGNLDINATENEKYQFVVDIASGKKNLDEIVSWVKAHIISL